MEGGRFREGLLLVGLFVLFWVSLQFGGTLMKAVAIFSTLMWGILIAVAIWLVLFKGATPSIVTKAKDFRSGKKNDSQGVDGDGDV